MFADLSWALVDIIMLDISFFFMQIMFTLGANIQCCAWAETQNYIYICTQDTVIEVVNLFKCYYFEL